MQGPDTWPGAAGDRALCLTLAAVLQQGLSPLGCPARQGQQATLEFQRAVLSPSGVPQGGHPPQLELVGVGFLPREVRAKAEVRVVWTELLDLAAGGRSPGREAGQWGSGDAVGWVSHGCHTPGRARASTPGRALVQIQLLHPSSCPSVSLASACWAALPSPNPLAGSSSGARTR